MDKTAEQILRKHIPDDCFWEDMQNLTNCPHRYPIAAMEEYHSLRSREQQDRIEQLEDGAVGLKHKIELYEKADDEWRKIVKRKNDKITEQQDRIERLEKDLLQETGKCMKYQQSIQRAQSWLKDPDCEISSVLHLLKSALSGEQDKEKERNVSVYTSLKSFAEKMWLRLFQPERDELQVIIDDVKEMENKISSDWYVGIINKEQNKKIAELEGLLKHAIEWIEERHGETHDSKIYKKSLNL